MIVNYFASHVISQVRVIKCKISNVAPNLPRANNRKVVPNKQLIPTIEIIRNLISVRMFSQISIKVNCDLTLICNL